MYFKGDFHCNLTMKYTVNSRKISNSEVLKKLKTLIFINIIGSSPSLSELTPLFGITLIIFNMGLTHLGSEASNNNNQIDKIQIQ